MANLQVIEKQDALVVDSRLIAEELEIQHKNFLETVRKYQPEIEEFGHLAFETCTVTNSVGAVNSVVFCYLNEEQATYVMTLSKNTEKVRKCKRNLVKAFVDARTKLQSRSLTPMEMIYQMAGAMVEKERRLSTLESQTEQLSAIVSSLEAEKQEAMEELTRLPLCPHQAQQLSVRSKVNIIVRNKAQRDLIPYNSLWNKLYQELYYRYSYDAKSRCNNSGLKPLDQIEKDNMMDILHAIASEILI